MIGLKASLFMDRAALRRHVGAANARFFTRAGAYTRAVARNSIRVRKGRQTREQRNARVGKPPVSRTKFFRNSILFDYDPSQHAVIIGPAGGRQDPSPAALEAGGTYPITVRTRQGRRRTAGRYRAFPTMGPALQEATPKLPQLWADAF